jgi:hypothetical protein
MFGEMSWTEKGKCSLRANDGSTKQVLWEPEQGGKTKGYGERGI